MWCLFLSLYKYLYAATNLVSGVELPGTILLIFKLDRVSLTSYIHVAILSLQTFFYTLYIMIPAYRRYRDSTVLQESQHDEDDVRCPD